MSYTDAPACKMLATHCAACRRPLLDATSVEVGMGPDCRKRLMPLDLPGREEANAIVRKFALGVSVGGLKVDAGVDSASLQAAFLIGGMDAVGQMLTPAGTDALRRLRELGYAALADKLGAAWTRRAAMIKIEEVDGGRLAVTSPYDAEAVRQMQQIRGRRWDGARKVNSFSATERAAVWAMLMRCYPGRLGEGPKGLFVIAQQRAVVELDWSEAEAEDRAEMEAAVGLRGP